jgi:hypothetical protein
MLKFWEHIMKKIENKQNLYYVGGTLCVDNDKTAGGVALNLDGCGFVYSNPYPFFKNWNGKIYMPQEITELVRRLYLEIKGETEHFIDTVKNDKRSNQNICTTA